jgi:hypothetical protein
MKHASRFVASDPHGDQVDAETERVFFLPPEVRRLVCANI